ncbi:MULTISPECIES: GNAT family N-acetyltransferase [unclassified Bradyrhizobium]|uniref:GNAT family N-acetyltransferase n=1 Tax=unclassified Bradyrhizobium TaxID=2631580 RepID=UPI002916E980|nr:MULTISPECIES: GNAT family N-acetyltransferase [unclassified Bradyrhizobium]
MSEQTEATETPLTISPDYVLRDPMPGDMGWIIHRHGVLFNKEYGFNAEFEAYIGEVVARFARTRNLERERCWLAEREAKVVGSVALVDDGQEIGRLRLLYVEPEARKLGIGQALVSTCVAEARRIGYRKLTLLTFNVLKSARPIYESHGFSIARERIESLFGRQLSVQDWDLIL